MWPVILLAVFASSSINIGKALQKRASESLPVFVLAPRTLTQYGRNRSWLIGLTLDLGGAVLTALALGNAPVSIIQPVGSLGIIVLAVFSRFYLKESFEFHQMVSAALCLAGTIGLGLSCEASPNKKGVHLSGLWAIASLGCFLGLLGSVTTWRRMSRLRKSVSTDEAHQKTSSVRYGLEAGGYIGLSAASTRTGFLFSSYSWIWVPVGIASSMILSGIGFVTISQGLKGGNTVTICTFANVSAMVTGILVGVIALGEQMPQSTGLEIVRLIGWILLGLGIAASSPGGVRKVGIWLKSVVVGVWLTPAKWQAGFRRLTKRLHERNRLNEAETHTNV